jgi:hypothetical protein
MSAGITVVVGEEHALAVGPEMNPERSSVRVPQRELAHLLGRGRFCRRRGECGAGGGSGGSEQHGGRSRGGQRHRRLDRRAGGEGVIGPPTDRVVARCGPRSVNP